MVTWLHFSRTLYWKCKFYPSKNVKFLFCFCSFLNLLCFCFCFVLFFLFIVHEVWVRRWETLFCFSVSFLFPHSVDYCKLVCGKLTKAYLKEPIISPAENLKWIEIQFLRCPLVEPLFFSAKSVSQDWPTLSSILCFYRWFSTAWRWNDH